ncbi:MULTISPECIES: hypothetical protein [unclassified Actinoplanes]|uniref:hypothetical protein n=1 Tax=unclassified Actinoplanes TaxID=2626549 RepID=UPI0012BAA215|nr:MULTISPECIES: hypothetical protein [unclassified Actinoplanes]
MDDPEGIALIKRLYLIMMPGDEEILISSLRGIIPGLLLVDGFKWPTPEPPLVGSIAEAKARRVLLWDERTFPVLPSVRQADGLFAGPSTRYVAALDRARVERGVNDADVLVSGSLSWSSSDESRESKEFGSAVMKAAKKVMRTKVRTQAGSRPAPQFLAGSCAVAWWKESPESRFFGLNAVGVLGVPEV